MESLWNLDILKLGLVRRRKKNTEDNDEVSLNTLNDKLDQILEEVRGKGSRSVAQVEIVIDKNPAQKILQP